MPNKRAKNKVWYAWWWERGKRVRKTTKKGNKKGAYEVVKKWEEENIITPSSTLEDFAEDMFIPGKCRYLAWKIEQGGLRRHTIYEHRKNLKKYILPNWGKCNLSELYEVKIEDTLRSLRIAGSTKNSILNTLNVILKEAKRARKIRHLPAFRRFSRHSTKPDILTSEEMKALFPDDPRELRNTWRENEKDPYGLMFGIMFRTILHAGLRPGEGRALSTEQVYPGQNTVLIDRQINSDGNLDLLKKATREDRRIRFTRIPENTMKLLEAWIEDRRITKGFLFLYDRKPVTKEYLEDRFEIGIRNAKIKAEERKLVPYSLRYTFRSRFQGHIDLQVIMQMMGHRSTEMSEHYLQIDPEQFQVYKEYQEKIDWLWS